MNRSAKATEGRRSTSVASVTVLPEKLSLTRPRTPRELRRYGVFSAPGKECSVASSCSSRVAQAANLVNPNKSAVLGDREHDGAYRSGEVS